MLILGSGSARRKELLESASIDFLLVPSDYNESQVAFEGDTLKYVETIAENKAKALLHKYPLDVILTADTVVEVDGEILGKPKDIEDAQKMLQLLNDKTHHVYTGVCIVSKDKKEVFVESASVTFNKLSTLDIESYIQTKEPMDKAGAYAIQGIGAKLIKQYDGDFHTIMGLPLKLVLEKLKDFNIVPKLK
ncbi:Maf family protein [Acholeplasma laidlawii]|uniref:dTTP/UTP pyrophosphatase n=2 Tax=Acholeplasma laidlawii TaxID=2148 RepID=NTPPA_ACHLI|nr:Maf family protein [Acholeplasma laidlawii]A9NE14.1 RecName: Full=dTTP/UTP pyrophosphatase; Short=dTTPase/UTPase; AltName: Full=Nucleoside triphosphate pyrophosphatase; AltName: Full=Nucleotide pyrophosphatase; Short=Nucleotide PPase [Acholeplasma laidlawii PG-8A]ABX81974.1 septum formation protein [Acholeplasma laidlawii PG-8A]RED19210.1 septum formation protein [Acholeplasma laidlawii]SQH57569.1 Septum formation protein Maf [Acholeplasma laidlawii]